MELSRQFLRDLEGIVGAGGVVSSPEGRLTYEADMHTFYRGAPTVVVLPRRAQEVLAVVRRCLAERVPIVPRGSGSFQREISPVNPRVTMSGPSTWTPITRDLCAWSVQSL